MTLLQRGLDTTEAVEEDILTAVEGAEIGGFPPEIESSNDTGSTLARVEGHTEALTFISTSHPLDLELALLLVRLGNL